MSTFDSSGKSSHIYYTYNFLYATEAIQTFGTGDWASTLCFRIELTWSANSAAFSAPRVGAPRNPLMVAVKKSKMTLQRKYCIANIHMIWWRRMEFWFSRNQVIRLTHIPYVTMIWTSWFIEQRGLQTEWRSGRRSPSIRHCSVYTLYFFIPFHIYHFHCLFCSMRFSRILSFLSCVFWVLNTIFHPSSTGGTCIRDVGVCKCVHTKHHIFNGCSHKKKSIVGMEKCVFRNR